MPRILWSTFTFLGAWILPKTLCMFLSHMHCITTDSVAQVFDLLCPYLSLLGAQRDVHFLERLEGLFQLLQMTFPRP